MLNFFRIRILLFLFSITAVVPNLDGQDSTSENLPIKYQDLITGEVQIYGKFSAPLGTPILGIFKKPTHLGSQFDIYHEVTSESFPNDGVQLFHVDELYGNTKVEGIVGYNVPEGTPFWFYEGLISNGLPVKFPQPANGVVLYKAGPFAIKSYLHVFVSAAPRNDYQLDAKPKSNSIVSKRIVRASDIESGKIKVLGKLNRVFGEVFVVDIKIIRDSNGIDWQIEAIAEDNNHQVFNKSDFSFRRAGGRGVEIEKVNLEETKWKAVRVYEELSIAGLPKVLRDAGFRGVKNQQKDFEIKSSLVMCLPD